MPPWKLVSASEPNLFSMDEKDNYNILKKIALEEGACLFGVADVRNLKGYFNFEPASLTEDLNYGISIGCRLSDKVVDSVIEQPTPLYSFHYRRTNILLDNIALKIASYIQKRNYQALPVPASQVVDWENQRGHLSHKMIARAAGLGWIGRNILLINPLYGARVRYVSVLTDLPLKVDQLLEQDCGSCTRCINVCPAGAIGQRKEDFKLDRCYEQTKKFSQGRGIGHYICGLCVRACPGVRRK